MTPLVMALASVAALFMLDRTATWISKRRRKPARAIACPTHGGAERISVCGLPPVVVCTVRSCCWRQDPVA